MMRRGFVRASMWVGIVSIAGCAFVGPREIRNGRLASVYRTLLSKSSPARAAVAVPYRGGWFYIDEDDAPTKRFFRMISVLWSATLADTAQRSAPVLTLPASR